MKWTKTIGGPGDDEGSSIVQTKNGGYAITGFTKSYTVGCYDAFLLKLDTAGGISSGGNTDNNTAGSGDALKNHGVLTNICTDITSASNVHAAPKTIEVYPNPCSNTLYLYLGTESNLSGKKADIKITDVTNRLVSALSVTLDSRPLANAYSIDVSSLSPGIYVVYIYLNGKTEVKKFTKE